MSYSEQCYQFFNQIYYQDPKMEYIDLRSDKVTVPTPQMRQAILTSQYGDHSYGDDKTVEELQAYTANLLGKQQASYVITGTFGNLCSILTAGKPGEEIIISDWCHMIEYQHGSIGGIARMFTRTIPGQKGMITVQNLNKYLRKVKDNQAPVSSIFAIQNPNCMAGKIYPIDQFQQLVSIAKKQGMHVHLDGARLLNACCQLNIQPKQLVKNCDSVMICLSKGLGAPIGSIVAGSKQFMKKFKSLRKMLGGNLRKPGVVAGPALLALKTMPPVLQEDNNMARYLAKRLEQLPWIEVVEKVEINLVFFTFTDKNINPSQFAKRLLENKIKSTINSSINGISRYVIHHYIRQKEIDFLIEVMKGYYTNLSEKK